jgi:hypothetical protein
MTVAAMKDPLALRVEAHALYLTQMLARLGYSGALDKHRRAQCRSCGTVTECARGLEEMAGEGGDEAPGFCLNRDYLASLPVRDAP